MNRLEIMRQTDLARMLAELYIAMEEDILVLFTDLDSRVGKYVKELVQATGEHMILTEEGWECGQGKAGVLEAFGEDAIFAEVNAPQEEKTGVLAMKIPLPGDGGSDARH